MRKIAIRVWVVFKMMLNQKFVFLMLLLSGLPGCKLGLRQDLESRRTQYKILLPDSVRFERIGGGTAAQIQFKTTEPAVCELFFYAQDPDRDPKKESPQRVKCQKAEAASEFNETVTNLREDTLYNVGVFVRAPDSPEGAGEALVVREQFSGSGATRREDGAFESIMMARFDVPLGAMEIQRVMVDPPARSAEIIAKIKSNLGCGPSLATPSWAGRSVAGVDGIDSFAFRGFATANAKREQNRLLTTFDSIQFINPNWEWTYKTPEKDNVLVKMRTPGRFTGVELAQAASAAIPEVDISKSNATTRLNGQSPLIVRWQWENLPEQSVVKVRIGRPGDATSIQCVFPANSGQGEIDGFRISGLPNGIQPMTVGLESLTFYAAQGWFAKSVDWRSINLEKS